MDNKEKKEKTKEELKPFLDSYTKLLIDGLIEDEIIKEKEDSDSKAGKTYELIRKVKQTVITNELSTQENKTISGFITFKNLVNNIYSDSEIIHNGIQKAKLKDIIKDFIEENLSRKSDTRISIFFDFLEKTDISLTSDEIDRDTIKYFETKNINFSIFINYLLEYYTLKKARSCFKDFDFDNDVNIGVSSKSKPDFVGQNIDLENLIFEVKYRKRIANTIKEMIFQAYEYLNSYNIITDKSNKVVIVAYTEEDSSKFEKLRDKFNQTILDLFPDYVNEIFFLPIAIYELQILMIEFEKLKGEIDNKPFETWRFFTKPVVISKAEKINTKFIQSSQGSFSIWVKLKPVDNYFDKFMNFEYIIAHATDNYNYINGVYQNVFSLSLAPNHTNNSGKKPTQLKWRFWISNAKRENFYLEGPELVNYMDEWYHLLIRWNHKVPILEFFINGKLVSSSDNYKKYWPEEVLDAGYIGTWGNSARVHFINLPFYRLISSSKFLNDGWVTNELKNKPNDYFA